MFAFLAAAAQATAPVPAMTDDWFSGVYDWPKNGLKRNELSTVSVAITVDLHGAFQSCSSTVYSGNPQMGPYICSRLRIRGVFEPARAPDGKKMYGVFRTFVILWDGDKEPPKNYRVADFNIDLPVSSDPKNRAVSIQFAVDQQGKTSFCSLVPKVGLGLYRRKQRADAAFVAKACSEIETHMRIEPARDRSGNAVPSVQSASVGGPVAR